MNTLKKQDQRNQCQTLGVKFESLIVQSRKRTETDRNGQEKDGK